MTDQSVMDDFAGRNEVVRDQKQQALRGALKRWTQGKDDPSVLLMLLDRKMVKGALSQEQRLEELIQWFLALRDVSRQENVLPSLPLDQLLEGFQNIGEKWGVDSHRFCAVLLERVLLEGEPESPVRVQARPSTKTKVLQAALEVFAEKGFHLATVDEIAERAGVGKGTLYRYFSNKETLFSELVRLRLEELEQKALTVLDGHDDVLTMIKKYLLVYFEFFDKNQRLYRVIVQERLDVGDQVQDLYVNKVMRRIPLLKRKIYEASQQGLLKDIDFHTVFYGVMGFVHGVIQKWLARDCAYSLVDELPGVMEVLFYGFVNEAKRLDR